MFYMLNFIFDTLVSPVSNAWCYCYCAVVELCALIVVVVDVVLVFFSFVFTVEKESNVVRGNSYGLIQ